ncbi:MAG: T9SS type A sorting domain-containing protein [Bacteroidales bacterium]|nr:T9SS type A sorting domain-containing protein [Bacteroidales bacterium]
MSLKPGIGFIFILISILFCSHAAVAVLINDTTYYESWNIDTLENIGGYPTTVTGNPQVISTDKGRAVKFDGDGDRLLIDANPLGDAKEFTIEIIFKPDGAYPLNTEPRFVHIQDPDDVSAKRVMIELRLTAENLWYLDGFMKTDNASLTLIDESLTHPTNHWMHAAITYQNSTFKTYVNGIEELNGNVTYASEIVAPTAKTSLGSRMDQRNWYSGLIKTFKVTHRVLAPCEFLTIDTNKTDLNEISHDRFKLFPNPANQYVTVSSFSISSPGYIKITDVLGKTIYRKEQAPAGVFIHKINTSGFAEGIYVIEIYSDTFIQAGKLIIRH